MSTQTFCWSGYNLGNAKNVELTRFSFNKDDRGYYLAATYRVEDDHAIREIDIPKIRLNLDKKRFCIKLEHDPLNYGKTGYVNLGFGDLPLDFDHDDTGMVFMFKDKIIEEKYTEMTLDEIEEKLGYKVKIVNK